jgi:hypothetical protein
VGEGLAVREALALTEANGHLERSAVIRVEARRTLEGPSVPTPKYNRGAPGGGWNRCSLPVAVRPSPMKKVWASAGESEAKSHIR